MIDGFLPGSRASLAIDLVALALIGVTPALVYSIRSVKRGRYRLHRSVQIILGALLFACVFYLEVDVRACGWTQRARPSPYYPETVLRILAVHLVFAVAAALAWTTATIFALRFFASPALPGVHSALHKKLGWLAVLSLAGTAVSGWVFYYAAFVAN